jgi:Rrf2 family protein
MSSIQMIGLSQTTGYAIQALSCLNNPACTCRSIATIAECSGVPRAYLAKIISALVRAGLVTARRGVGGGIALGRQPAEISLLQIVEAIQGPSWLGECLLGMDDCASDGACPTHEFWLRVRGEITAELGRTTLAEVISFRAGRSNHTKRPADCGRTSARSQPTSPRSIRPKVSNRSENRIRIAL